MIMTVCKRIALYWLGLLFATQAQAVIGLSQVRIVNVTPHGFSVVAYADQPAAPSIQIFSDAAGANEITDRFEVIPYPLQGGNPDNTQPYAIRQHQRDFAAQMQTRGLLYLQVRGLGPAQTWYFRLYANNDSDSGSWPASDTAAVTTQTDNSWVIDARQLLIRFTQDNIAGWPVMVSAPGASYPVAALIADGAGAKQAAVNIANLFDFTGVNWQQAGTQTLTLEVLTSDGQLLNSTVDVLLSPEFAVASDQVVDFDAPFNGFIQMTEPASPVYTRADSFTLAWLDDAPGVNGIVSLYYDNDNQGEDGVLIATAINEDDDGPGDRYSWDLTAISDGRYYLYAVLSDGSRTTSSYAPAAITIDRNRLDGDGDGMSDLWETFYFGDLARDGSGDFDGDGRSDLQEYQEGTNPLQITGISTPVILSPLPGTEVTDLRPVLTVQNSLYAPAESATYTCELYSDASLTQLVTQIANIPEGSGQTQCHLALDLNDNQHYYWRARATVAGMNSQWVNGAFFVNTANDPPQAPTIANPVNGAIVDTRQPQLEVVNGSDVDGDVLGYRFELYADALLTQLVQNSPPLSEGAGRTSWLVAVPLNEDQSYFWRVVVSDEDGATAVSTVARFTVNSIVSKPGVPQILAPADGAEVQTTAPSLRVNNAIDPYNLPLVYRFELDTVSSFDSPALQQSGDIAEGSGSTAWQVNGLMENTLYYWRVSAANSGAESDWVTASFFVNSVNEAPTVPVVNNPDDQTTVETRNPQLSVNPSSDPDGDTIRYRFELYADSSLNGLLASAVIDTTQWTPPLLLADNRWFWWRVRAQDEHGLASDWSALKSFFVNDSGIDDSPNIQLLTPASEIADATQAPIDISWNDDDPDSNARIALYYDTDTQGADGVLIVANIEEDSDGEGDHYSWDASALPPGHYYLYATIADATSSSTVYLPTRITIPEKVLAWTDISTQLAIRQSNPLRNRRSPDARVDIDIRNPGADLPGPFRLVLDLSASVALAIANADGLTDTGQPYFDLGPYFDTTVFTGGSAMRRLRVTVQGGGRNSFVLTARVEQLKENIRPDIHLLAPASDIADASLLPVEIRWQDSDPDSAAKIALYYDTDTSGNDGKLIVGNIEEDIDLLGDSYQWDASTLPPGTYYIYAVIADGASSRTVYLPTAITIPAPVPQWHRITAELGLQISNPVRSRRSPNARVDVTLSNTGTTTLSLPMRLLVSSLMPAGTVSLAGSDGVTDNGIPWIDLAAVISGQLNPGQSVTVPLVINHGGRNSFSLSVDVERFY